MTNSEQLRNGDSLLANSLFFKAPWILQGLTLSGLALTGTKHIKQIPARPKGCLLDVILNDIKCIFRGVNKPPFRWCWSLDFVWLTVAKLHLIPPVESRTPKNALRGSEASPSDCACCAFRNCRGQGRCESGSMIQCRC